MQCAGTNRRWMKDERASWERNSEPSWPRVLHGWPRDRTRSVDGGNPGPGKSRSEIRSRERRPCRIGGKATRRARRRRMARGGSPVSKNPGTGGHPVNDLRDDRRPPARLAASPGRVLFKARCAGIGEALAPSPNGDRGSCGPPPPVARSWSAAPASPACRARGINAPVVLSAHRSIRAPRLFPSPSRPDDDDNRLISNNAVHFRDTALDRANDE